MKVVMCWVWQQFKSIANDKSEQSKTIEKLAELFFMWWVAGTAVRYIYWVSFAEHQDWS